MWTHQYKASWKIMHTLSCVVTLISKMNSSIDNFLDHSRNWPITNETMTIMLNIDKDLARHRVNRHLRSVNQQIVNTIEPTTINVEHGTKQPEHQQRETRTTISSGILYIRRANAKHSKATWTPTRWTLITNERLEHAATPQKHCSALKRHTTISPLRYICVCMYDYIYMLHISPLLVSPQD